jgi:hypothetical protein
MGHGGVCGIRLCPVVVVPKVFGIDIELVRCIE